MPGKGNDWGTSDPDIIPPSQQSGPPNHLKSIENLPTSVQLVTVNKPTVNMHMTPNIGNVTLPPVAHNNPSVQVNMGACANTKQYGTLKSLLQNSEAMQVICSKPKCPPPKIDQATGNMENLNMLANITVNSQLDCIENLDNFIEMECEYICHNH